MPTLFAWLGNSDLRASEDASGTDFGPILMALETGVYDRLVLLSDHGQQKTQNFVAWLSGKFTGATEVRYAKLRSPTDFEDIYVAANGAVSATLSSSPELPVTFHVSPGTPAMAAVWVLLAKAKYGADLIESSREHGVRPVVVPSTWLLSFFLLQARMPMRRLHTLCRDCLRPRRSSAASSIAAAQ